MTAIVDKDPGPTDPPGPAAPTKKPARPKRYVVILVLVMLFGGLSPFVALGVLGGVALERLSSQKERSRRERGFDGFLVAVMLVALVAFPIGHAMVDRHNERELQEAVDQLRNGQQN